MQPVVRAVWGTSKSGIIIDVASRHRRRVTAPVLENKGGDGEFRADNFDVKSWASTIKKDAALFVHGKKIKERRDWI